VAGQTVRNEEAWAARRRLIGELFPTVDRMVVDTYGDKRLPSLAAALVVDGKLSWWRTLGARDLATGEAITPHTVFRVGSITKVVTAMAALALRDEGKLAFDVPATTYLPELDRVVYPTTDTPLITVRHLLTHTSGLPRLGKFDYGSPEASYVNPRQVLESLRGIRLEFTPGTGHGYSNLGFAVLGLIVGRAAGSSYRDYVSKTILEPIGMRSATWEAEAVPRDQLAVGYVRRGGQYQVGRPWPMGAAEGMGGLYTSMDDLVRLVSLHATAWPPGARASQPPLSNASLRESHMLGGHQLPSVQGTGYGWGVSRQAGLGHLVFHTGSTDNYAATAMFLPEHRLAFVALSNTGAAGDALDKLGGRVLSHLARELRGR
jgi:CubicO group peptidase (beta-lactamase class C family)